MKTYIAIASAIGLGIYIGRSQGTINVLRAHISVQETRINLLEKERDFYKNKGERNDAR